MLIDEDRDADRDTVDLVGLDVHYHLNCYDARMSDPQHWHVRERLEILPETTETDETKLDHFQTRRILAKEINSENKIVSFPKIYSEKCKTKIVCFPK